MKMKQRIEFLPDEQQPYPGGGTEENRRVLDGRNYPGDE